MNYYNENDPKTADWLEALKNDGLIPDGDIDRRSICDVQPSDLDGYTQHHFFAGIGGWPYALQLAGWPADRPVWTGSCPCQPFSKAGKGKGTKDERHLWPEFARLIKECQPEAIFGEQVASAEVVGTQLEASFALAVQRGDFAAANRYANKLVKSSGFGYWKRWVDGVQADLEETGHTLRIGVLGAHSVGAPHIRQRLFWVAYGGYGNNSRREVSGREARREAQGSSRRMARRGSSTRGLPDTQRGTTERHGHEMAGTSSSNQGREEERQRIRVDTGDAGEPRGVCNPSHSRLEGHSGHGDGGDKPGRLETEPGGPVAETVRSSGLCVPDCAGSQPGRTATKATRHRDSINAASCPGFWSDFDILPFRDGKQRRVESGTSPLAHGVPARVVRLRGYGNAIVPQVAAEFVMAFMDAMAEQ